MCLKLRMLLVLDQRQEDALSSVQVGPHHSMNQQENKSLDRCDETQHDIWPYL